MKLLFLLITLSFYSSLSAQNIKVDSCEKDSNPLLNTYKASYFNVFLKEQKGDFDFPQKDLAFVSGSFNENIQDKAIIISWSKIAVTGKHSRKLLQRIRKSL